MTSAPVQTPAMPGLTESQHGFHHTVDSALGIFSALGISASRITLRMAGRGLPTRWIAAQKPVAGTPLGPGKISNSKWPGWAIFIISPRRFGTAAAKARWARARSWG